MTAGSVSRMNGLEGALEVRTELPSWKNLVNLLLTKRKGKHKKGIVEAQGPYASFLGRLWKKAVDLEQKHFMGNNHRIITNLLGIFKRNLMKSK